MKVYRLYYNLSLWLLKAIALTQMEDQFIDMRIAVSRLLESAVVYQHKFETSQRNFERMNDRFSVIITEIRDIRRQEYEDEMPGDSGSLE